MHQQLLLEAVNALVDPPVEDLRFLHSLRSIEALIDHFKSLRSVAAIEEHQKHIEVQVSFLRELKGALLRVTRDLRENINEQAKELKKEEAAKMAAQADLLKKHEAEFAAEESKKVLKQRNAGMFRKKGRTASGLRE